MSRFLESLKVPIVLKLTRLRVFERCILKGAYTFYHKRFISNLSWIVKLLSSFQGLSSGNKHNWKLKKVLFFKKIGKCESNWIMLYCVF